MLDCLFCGERYADFSDLAFHVTYRCDRAPHSIVSRRAREQKSPPIIRVPSRRPTPAPRQASGIPRSHEQTGGDFPSFLRPTDIGKGKLGARAKLAFVASVPARTITSNFGRDQFVLRVKLNGKVYDWPINLDSGNHRRLDDRFKGASPWDPIATTRTASSRSRWAFSLATTIAPTDPLSYQRIATRESSHPRAVGTPDPIARGTHRRDRRRDHRRTVVETDRHDSSRF